MRLWSLHPGQLDAKGLVALWREALLAQKVLRGETQGYKHHPQLQRFSKHRNPLGAIAAYLQAVQSEAARRGYRFDQSKITATATRSKIAVSAGQLAYEYAHLLAKLKLRDPAAYRQLRKVAELRVNPLFVVVPGGVEAWEVVRGRP
jgi:hypothetical protein